jgi:hypothetical protein
MIPRSRRRRAPKGLTLAFLLASILPSFQPSSCVVQAFAPHQTTPSSSITSTSNKTFRIKSILQSTAEDTSVSKNKRGARSTPSASASSSKSTTSNKKAKTYKDIKDFKRAKQAYTASTSATATTPSPATATATASSQSQKKNQESQVPHAAAAAAAQEEAAHDEHDAKRRIHSINSIRSSRTSEERKRSVDRMSKARLLLKDLSSDAKVNDLNDIASSTGTDSNVSGSGSGSGSGNTRDDGAVEDKTAPTVPDTFWYNGNLQQGKGDYVTRWARGVKVAEPLRKYDPVAAEKLLFLQPTKWIVRNVQIAFPLGLWAIGVALDVVMNTEVENRKNRAKQLLETISGLGPAIIKGGQALASRSDLMPSEYLDQLQKLQDDVPRFDNKLALATVEDELEVDFDSVFELVEPEPIAAASIGQVYKARLRSNGDLVAIKIQRPNCEQIIALDLYVLRWWSGVANVLTKLLNRDINVQSIIDDFGELIYRELDYVAEAANAQRFSELYS